MGTFTIDPYQGFSEAELKRRCRDLTRAGIERDTIIFLLIHHGGFDALPRHFKEKVQTIVATYGDGKGAEDS